MISYKIKKYITDDNNSLGMTVNLWLNTKLKNFLLSTVFIVLICAFLFLFKMISFAILPKNQGFLVLENMFFYLFLGASLGLTFPVLNKINNFYSVKKFNFIKPMILGAILSIPQVVFYTLYSNDITHFFMNLILQGKNINNQNIHYGEFFFLLAFPSLINSIILFSNSFLLINLSIQGDKYKKIQDYIKGEYKSIKTFISLNYSVTNIICLNILLALFGFFILFTLTGTILGLIKASSFTGLAMTILSTAYLIFFVISFVINIIGGFFKIYKKSHIKFSGTNNGFKEVQVYGIGVCKYTIPEGVNINK